MNNAKKLAFFLPNSFTALNLACGFAAMILSVRGMFYEACLVLILGAIFDSVDGRVARMTGTQSSFGEQFDSMSDVVSFGVAPSFLIYQKYLIHYGRLGAVAAFVFLLCGALRLARFNSNIDKVSSDFFQGLPIPSAALAIIALVLFADQFPVVDSIPLLPVIYTVFYGVLMVTTIPFCSFKNSKWVKDHKKMVLFFVLLLVALIFSYYRIMTILVITSYVVGSILYYLKKRREFGDVFQWNDEH